MSGVLLSDIEYASFLAYLIKECADTEHRKYLHDVVFRIKQDRVLGTKPVSQLVAARLKGLLDELPFGDFFSPDTVLVATPRSRRVPEGYMWPAQRIAQALAAKGLGQLPPIRVLDRETVVSKSAYAATQGTQRPTAQQHFETIMANPSLENPVQFLLVDDVLTHGQTLLGAASRLRIAYPDVPIRCFAVARATNALPIVNGVETVRDPRRGRILHRQGYTHLADF